MLSEKLIELRKKRGLGQGDLAEYLKITKQAYSMYETSKREMNFDSLCLLADYYNVSTDYLLGRTEITNAPFDDEELNVIMSFRKLDNRGKEAIKANLAFELSHVPISKPVKKSAI